MNASDCWQLFLETGAPEMYLLYHKALRMEEDHVLGYPRAGTAGDGL